MFAAVLYVLVSGESWRALPKSFPVSWQNAYRRFGQWCDEDLWNRMAATARATPHISAPVRDWAERVEEAARSRRTARAAGTGLAEGPADRAAGTELAGRAADTDPTDHTDRPGLTALAGRASLAGRTPLADREDPTHLPARVA